MDKEYWYEIEHVGGMHKKLTELDDSDWVLEGTGLEVAYQRFLEMHRKQATYHIDGLKFTCPPNIYHPGEFSSTRFALRGLFSQLAKWGNRILEVGTGSGAIGLCLSANGRDVTMVDIDPVAVECAKNNALHNNIHAEIYQSDLFEAVCDQKYDLIIFNIPLMDKAIEEPIEVIACDFQGQLFIKFMNEAKRHLLPGGQVCVSVSNLGNRNAIMQGLSNYNESIVYSEYYAASNEWRWLLVAQPQA